MRSLLVRWLINILAIYVAVQVVPGVDYDRGPLGLLVVAAIFGLVNATVRPLLTVLTCPFILVTLGLFLFVINAIMLLLTAWLSSVFNLGFEVSGFGSAFGAGLMISLTTLLLSFLVGDRDVRVVRH
ncbi:MAG: phage holin family protein [Gemmatimonadota bacterium]|nr:phage holin family protein [Gemmatimonadota bacterium]MDH4348857.1 phage holin family protein [Gemmatimonadota bacterium]